MAYTRLLQRPNIFNPWALLIALMLSSVTTLAAAPLEVSVDANPSRLGDTITLSVRIEGQSSAQQPTLPQLPSHVAVSGPSSNAVTQIINFKTQRYTEFKYRLTPQKAGTIKIGSIVMMVNGTLQRSQPFQLTVSERDTALDNQQLWVEAEINPTVAYPGQQVIYTFRVYQGVELAESSYSPPKFEGMLEEPQPQNGNRTYSTRKNGREYKVTELRHILFPTRVGSFTLGQATLEAAVIKPRSQRSRRRGDPFDSFFGGSLRREIENRSVSTEAINLQVLAPPKGKPENYTGLVGSFRISSKVSATTVKQGESAVLTVSVSGTGNVRDIPEPNLELDGFKAYSEPVQQDVHIDQRSRQLKGSRIFKASLIALEPGTYDIPPMTLSFLDPEIGRYRQVKSKAIKLTVLKADAAQNNIVTGLNQTVAQSEVEVAGEDILPVKRSPALSAPILHSFTSPVALALLLAPPLAFLGLGLRQRQQAAMLANPSGQRIKNAKANALAALQQGKDTPSAKTQARELDRALKGYIGDKLDIAGHALTTQETLTVLHERTVPPSLIEEVNSLLQQLDQVQYMPEVGQQTHLANLRQSTETLVLQLDKELSR